MISGISKLENLLLNHALILKPWTNNRDGGNAIHFKPTIQCMNSIWPVEGAMVCLEQNDRSSKQRLIYKTCLR